MKPITGLSGSDRIATAVAISQDTFSTVGTFAQSTPASAVILSRADVYADALTGTPLALSKGGPLLLTPPNSLDPRTQAEIQRVLPSGGTVYFLGGTAALGTSVESAITNLGFKVTRYAGPTRFDTAVVIAHSGLGDPTTIVEATGGDFPDALGGGAAAAQISGAVLLTVGSAQSQATAAYLGAHSGDTRYALGGPAAAADPSATPLVGADRFETATKVAGQFFTGPTVVGIADGLKFPDALAGGAHIARQHGPLIIVPESGPLPSSVASYLSTNASTIANAYVYGGTAAVGTDVRNEVQAAINGMTPVSDVRPIDTWAWLHLLLVLALAVLALALGQRRRMGWRRQT